MSQLDLFAPERPTALTNDYRHGLNDRQWEAVEVPADKAVQVLAGAGTGKTELISRRFVKLVKDLKANGIRRPQDRILVVTFTSEAALSMRARIQQALADNGEEGLGADAWIGTFHQLAGRMLRSHPLETQLPPDFTILNSLEQQVLFARVMQRVQAGEAENLHDVLSEAGLSGTLPPEALSIAALQQLGFLGIEHLLAPERMALLINRIKTSGLTPQQFYGLAMAQSAGLTDALRHLPVPHDPAFGGLENIQQKLDAWRAHLDPWVHPGWDPRREAEQQIARRGDKPTPGKYKDACKFLANFLLVSRTFEPLTPDFSSLDRSLALEQSLIGLIAAVHALYQHTLRQQRACDFDDLINHAIHLLDRHPGLQAHYQGLFEAIIVDEFQDSNGSQLRLLELLSRDPPNLTVVGDEKQSIYAFRFAQPENLDLIFRNKPCHRVSLQINYRSTPPVLAVANALTPLLTERGDQTLTPCDSQAGQEAPPVTWVNLDERLDTGRTDRQGEVILAHPPIWLQKDREARFIAVEIARLAASGEARFEDIAVLVKSHAKAEAIQAALSEFNIPSVRQKNLGFFEEGVIKDAMALLRLMRNLGEDKALVRILQGRLNHRQIRSLVQLKKKLEVPSLFEVCRQLGENPALAGQLPPGVQQAVASLADNLLAVRKQQARLSPVQLFHKLARQVGLIHPATPEWQKKQQRTTLRTLEKMLYLFGHNRPLAPTLDEVIETLERHRDNPNQELPVAEVMRGENAVQIMTVYAAKGLEFPVVFAAYTEAARSARTEDSLLLFDPQYPGKAGYGLILGRLGRAPTLKKELYQAGWLKPRSRTEQQRVFYVALTRAKQRLYVIRCGQSEEWTAPDGFPRHAIRVLSQSDHAEALSPYFDADPAAIRAQMDALLATPG